MVKEEGFVYILSRVCEHEDISFLILHFSAFGGRTEKKEEEQGKWTWEPQGKKQERGHKKGIACSEQPSRDAL